MDLTNLGALFNIVCILNYIALIFGVQVQHLMFEYTLPPYPLRLIYHEALLNEILILNRYLPILLIGELQRHTLDVLEVAVAVSTGPWLATINQLECQNTNAPYITLSRVGMTIQQLWSHVEGGPYALLHQLPSRDVDLSSKTKISHLKHIIMNQSILWFNVPMDVALINLINGLGMMRGITISQKPFMRSMRTATAFASFSIPPYFSKYPLRSPPLHSSIIMTFIITI